MNGVQTDAENVQLAENTALKDLSERKEMFILYLQVLFHNLDVIFDFLYFYYTPIIFGPVTVLYFLTQIVPPILCLIHLRNLRQRQDPKYSNVSFLSLYTDYERIRDFDYN